MTARHAPPYPADSAVGCGLFGDFSLHFMGFLHWQGHFITFSQFEGHLGGFKSSSEGRFIHWKVTPEGSLLMKGPFCALAV